MPNNKKERHVPKVDWKIIWPDNLKIDVLVDTRETPHVVALEGDKAVVRMWFEEDIVIVSTQPSYMIGIARESKVAYIEKP